MPLCAQADDFDERISLAKQALASPQGRAYRVWFNSQLSPAVTKTLQSCFLNLEAPDKSDFVVVADVGSFGRLLRIAARPSTDLASCFVKGLEAATFSEPPSLGAQAFPIYIEL